jgi:hypothetical protein
MKKRKQIKEFLERKLGMELIEMFSFQVIYPASGILGNAFAMHMRKPVHEAGRQVYKSIKVLVNYEG